MAQKSQQKATVKQIKQQQQQKKQKRMRVLIWGIVVCFIALIAAAIILKPKAGVVDIAYDKVPTLGSVEAPVKIAEFGDFKCPTCQYFSKDILSQIKKDYVDTGKASFSFLNFTIIAQDSYTAALAGQSIYHQNKDEFWKFYDALYENQQADEQAAWATPDFLTELAKSNGVNVDYDKLRKDIDEGTYSGEIDKQNALARKKNFTGTPTVLINGKVLDSSVSLDYSKLKVELDKAVEEAGK
ncbi:DsbA family protein [Cohnella faecalis]|uniref:DsbA family protein n=1 Tax=Cohnella faecalis TaxID=2315694 RepID=UPI0013140657|nr:thioredoxin domain-containing protein [Cohnella faecalis]